MVIDGCLSCKEFNGDTQYFISVKYEMYTLKVITKEVITAALTVILVTTKVILATEEVITASLKVILVTTKVILATEEVITATLKLS